MNRPKKTSKWPTDTWKRAPHHSASGKYKSKPQWDTTLHQSKWLKLTSQETTDVGEDVEKGESSYTVGGNATLENSMEAPQKVKNVTTQRLSNCPIRCLSKVHKGIWRGKSTPMFIVKLLKEPRCPSTDEWIKKMWYTHTHTHTHTGILRSHKKDRHLAICNDVDGNRAYYAEQNKSIKERKLSYNLSDMRNLRGVIGE